MLVRYGCCGYAAAASGANRRAAPVGAPMSAEDAAATEQLLLQEALHASLGDSPAPPPAAAAAGRIPPAPARAPARPLWPALERRPSSSAPMPGAQEAFVLPAAAHLVGHGTFVISAVQTGRHYLPVDVIKKAIDAMAAAKMSKLLAQRPAVTQSSLTDEPCRCRRAALAPDR